MQLLHLLKILIRMVKLVYLVFDLSYVCVMPPILDKAINQQYCKGIKATTYQLHCCIGYCYLTHCSFSAAVNSQWARKFQIKRLITCCMLKLILDSPMVEKYILASKLYTTKDIIMSFEKVLTAYFLHSHKVYLQFISSLKSF